MTKEELKKRLDAYAEIAERYDENCLGDLPEGWGAKLHSVLSDPEQCLLDGMYHVEARVHRNARAASWDPKDENDEGGVENGSFYDDEILSFPWFVLEGDFWDRDLDKDIKAHICVRDSMAKLGM
jgi:hypothetical protein